MGDMQKIVNVTAKVISGEQTLEEAKKYNSELFVKKRKLEKFLAMEIQDIEMGKEKDAYLKEPLSPVHSQIENFCYGISRDVDFNKKTIYVIPVKQDKQWLFKRMQYGLQELGNKVNFKAISSFSKQKLRQLRCGSSVDTVILNYIRHVDGKEARNNVFKAPTVPHNLKTFIMKSDSMKGIILLVNEYPTLTALKKMESLKDNDFEFVLIKFFPTNLALK